MYEAWFGMIDPPRDYSVYDMSWVGPAASLISTVADLNRFYGLLLAGEIVDGSSLAQMQCTVPVISFEGKKIDLRPRPAQDGDSWPWHVLGPRRHGLGGRSNFHDPSRR